MTRHFNTAANAWTLTNPGECITIYQTGKFIAESYSKACSAENILSGFRAAGVWQLNPDIFEDDDFLPAETFRSQDPPVTPQAEQTTSLLHQLNYRKVTMMEDRLS